ncbi:FtsK/SpoIIIE domain-containing protein [Halalkalibacter okhensis]|uniref:FtsK/SpoIIIE domain-containing protein n=1 Tax=Halalkalibacter okhensis TaxID=333138 RepID=UPI0006904EEC|nr:FtsK/SpoIIIE domain-containing protein [Halalkalibacter okhensis]
MFLEIGSSVVMAGLASYTYLYQSGVGGNDTKKIENISKNCGLVAKDGKTIRIHRKSRKKKYSEYVFQMPQGLSSKEFESKLDNFQDGLNIKRSVPDVSIHDFKEINWKKDIVKQIQMLLEKKRNLRKEVHISFDGMLIFRVYNEPLTTRYEFEESLTKRHKEWEVPIGIGRTDYIKHNFDDVPNIIVAGVPGFGKSNWLKCLVTFLIDKKADKVKLTLIDLKDGLTFGRYDSLKQVDTVAKDPEEAKEALKDVQQQMIETNKWLYRNGYEDIKEAGVKDRHFIIIDEAADIADDEECQDIIKDIARRGRASGYRLIYATQYPTAETVPSQVKRNCIGRLCFTVDSATASRVVIDQEGAEKLPLIKGRAIYKTIRCEEVQTPAIDNGFIEKTISPHIVIKARQEEDSMKGDDSSNDTKTEERAKRGADSFIIKEV